MDCLRCGSWVFIKSLRKLRHGFSPISFQHLEVMANTASLRLTSGPLQVCCLPIPSAARKYSLRRQIVLGKSCLWHLLRPAAFHCQQLTLALAELKCTSGTPTPYWPR
eukprot:symbB.v1.2.009443.t1/scaffold601.1/size182750/7